MQGTWLPLPRQRSDRPKAPSRVNNRSRFAPDLLFAALYNERAGVAYDLVAPFAGPGTLAGTAAYQTDLGALEQGILVAGSGNHLTFGNPTKLQFTETSSFTILS